MERTHDVRRKGPGSDDRPNIRVRRNTIYFYTLLLLLSFFSLSLLFARHSTSRRVLNRTGQVVAENIFTRTLPRDVLSARHRMYSVQCLLFIGVHAGRTPGCTTTNAAPHTSPPHIQSDPFVV